MSTAMGYSSSFAFGASAMASERRMDFALEVGQQYRGSETMAGCEREER